MHYNEDRRTIHGPNESREFAQQDMEIRGTRMSIQAIMAAEVHIRKPEEVTGLIAPPVASGKSRIPAGTASLETSDRGVKQH